MVLGKEQRVFRNAGSEGPAQGGVNKLRKWHIVDIGGLGSPQTLISIGSHVCPGPLGHTSFGSVSVPVLLETLKVHHCQKLAGAGGGKSTVPG